MASLGWLQPGLTILLAMVLILLGFVFVRKRRSSWLVFAAVAMVAAIRFIVADPDLRTTSINHKVQQLQGQDIEVEGRVCGEPKFLPYQSGLRGRWVFPLQLEGLCAASNWISQSGEIDVVVMGGVQTEPCARIGQRIRAKGVLQPRKYPHGNLLELKVAWPRYCACLGAPRVSYIVLCRAWRESVAERLSQGIGNQPVHLAVLRSLVLGYRNEIPYDTYACFKRTGALHIFALSGLHVGITGLPLVIVLKSAGVPRDWFGVWLIPLLFTYVAATGMKASALRAMVMAGVFLLAPLFRRKPDIPTSVAFAAIVLLLLNPHELESAGFVFSFVVVAFIVMVYAVVPEHWLAGHWLKGYGVSLAITSFAASLASMPMTAFYFGRFSPIALVGNLVVVPLTFCIVLSGWLSILIPPASVVFNHAAVVFIDLMLRSIRWFDGLPGSSMPVDAPPYGAIMLWYVSLVYLQVHAARTRQRILAMVGAGCAVLLAVLL